MSPIRARAYNGVFLLLAFAALVFALYPGRFDGDAIWQYRGASQWFLFDDSHSVMDAALLGLLSDIAKGPGPMTVLQLALWIGGLFLLTDALVATGRPAIGQAISLLALTPLLAFDFFDVQKDALFSGLMAALIGIGVRRMLGLGSATLIGAFAAFCLFMLALDTRQNAVFALVPLWLLAWPVRTLAWRPALIAAGAGLVAFTAASQADRWIDRAVLQTNQSHLIYALALYDLAGITARTHQDASEGLLPEFPVNVAKCYAPTRWDAFLGGPCQVVGLKAQARMASGPYRRALLDQWIKEIVLHPVAYAAHRARNFGCLVRVGCYDDQVMSSGWTSRPWDDPGVRVTVAARILGRAADLLWRGPASAGWLWILALSAELSAAATLLRRRGFEPMAYLAMILAAAGLTYVFSFAVAGVADQLRYLHPVMFLAILAAPPAIAATWRALRSSTLAPAEETTVAYLWPRRSPAWATKWRFARTSGFTPPGAEPDARS